MNNDELTNSLPKSPARTCKTLLQALKPIFMPSEQFSIEIQVPYTDFEGKLKTSVKDFLMVDISTIDELRSSQELFCINPLQPLAENRQGSSLLLYRNFLLESDDSATPVEEQLRRLEPHKSDFRLMTLSGGKSVHCIISCADTLPFKVGDDPAHTAYKEVWEGLNRYYSRLTGLKFDTSTKNPNRVSRIPGVVRSKTGNEQTLLNIGGLQTAEDLMSLRVPSQGRALRSEHVATNLKMFVEILNCTRQGRRFRDIMETDVYTWAGSETMRKPLFKYACWAIDLTNCSYDVLWTYLQEHTFPVLRSRGYPESKFEEPINSAYKHKGIL